MTTSQQDADHDDVPAGLVQITVEQTNNVVIVTVDGQSIVFPSAALFMIAETLTNIDKCGPFRGVMTFDFVPGECEVVQ